MAVSQDGVNVLTSIVPYHSYMMDDYIGFGYKGDSPRDLVTLNELASGISVHKAEQILKLQLNHIENQLSQHIPFHASLDEITKFAVTAIAFTHSIHYVLNNKLFLMHLEKGRYGQAASALRNCHIKLILILKTGKLR
jgi:hypothetical protein